MFKGFLFGKKDFAEVERAEQAAEEKTEQKPTRAILNGLLYDTSKAKKILEYYDPVGNGSYWSYKTLYITENGRFFCKNSFGDLKKLNDDDAKSILSKYPDKYQEIFGKVEEA